MEERVAAGEWTLAHESIWDFDAAGAPHEAHLDVFSEALFGHFVGFTHETRNEFFKGLSVGSSKNCEGIVLKGLKTAFDALGIASSSYSGLQFRSFRRNEIAPYVRKLAAAGVDALASDVTKGFRATAPSAAHSAKPTDDEKTKIDAMVNDWAVKAQPLAHEGGAVVYDQDFRAYLQDYAKLVQSRNHVSLGAGFRSKLKTGDFVRVSEFAFRSDARPPVMVRALGGFHPNAIRDDLANTREEHAARGDLAFDPFFHQTEVGTGTSAYVSTSRNLRECFYFVRNCQEAWIYVLRCIDAVDVLATFQQPNVPAEVELSMPGGVGWPNVMGWRKLVKVGDGQLAWEGAIYLSTDAQRLPNDVRERLLTMLQIPIASMRRQSAADAHGKKYGVGLNL